MKGLFDLLMIYLISYSLAAPVEPQSGLNENALIVASPKSSNSDDALLSRLAKLTDGPLNFDDVLWLKIKLMPRLEEHFENAYMHNSQTLHPAYQNLLDALEKLFRRPEVQRLMEIVIKPLRRVDRSIYETAKGITEFRLQFIIHRNILEVKKYYFSSERYEFDGENKFGFAPTPRIMNCIHEANQAQLLLCLFASNTTPVEQLFKEWKLFQQTAHPPFEKLEPFMKNWVVYISFRNLQTTCSLHATDLDYKHKANPSTSDPTTHESDRNSKRRKLTENLVSKKVDPDTKLIEVAERLEASDKLIKGKIATWPIENDIAAEADALLFLKSIEDAMNFHLQLIKSYEFVQEYSDRYIEASLAMARSNIYPVMRSYLQCIQPYDLFETSLQLYQSIFLTINKFEETIEKRLMDRYGFLPNFDPTEEQLEYINQFCGLCYKHKYMKLLCKTHKELLKLGKKPPENSLIIFIQENWKNCAMMDVYLNLLEENALKRAVSQNFQTTVKNLTRRNKVSLNAMRQFCTDNGRIWNSVYQHALYHDVEQFVEEYTGNRDIMANNGFSDGLIPGISDLEKEFGVIRKISEHKPNLMSEHQNIHSTRPSFEVSHAVGTSPTGSTSGGTSATSKSLVQSPLEVSY